MCHSLKMKRNNEKVRLINYFKMQDFREKNLSIFDQKKTNNRVLSVISTFCLLIVIIIFYNIFEKDFLN